MKNSLYIFSFLWLASALALCGLAVIFLNREQHITSLLLVLISLTIIIWRLFIFYLRIEEVEKLVLALQQKDFTLFPKTYKQLSVYDNAVKLFYELKEENRQVTFYKSLYENILDNLDFGLMILSYEQTIQDWKIFYANPNILRTLRVPRYKWWNYYEEKIPVFYQLVSSRLEQDSQDFLDISIHSSAKESYSLRTASLTTPTSSFCIVTLESVQRIVEHKEKLAWNNLMKVISHELLNTLTPINSLMDNLHYLFMQDEMDQEEKTEIKDSLEIIHSRSQELLHFINNYRQVAQLPKPQRKPTMIQPVLEDVLAFMQSEFKNHNIQINKNLQNVLLHIDIKMIERVLINLLSNAIYSFEGTHNHTINIRTFNMAKRFKIVIEDNGIGVDQKIRDKIFMPFFTTRKNGSGIGLTLAKSIMEAHKGYLSYRTIENGSSFEMIFVK